MKKRFISLVAAAALVGGVAAVSTPTVASAGTVTVKGDTQVQLYGFLEYTAGWTNKMQAGYPGFINQPYEEPSKNNDAAKTDDTKFSSTLNHTRLGLNFKNEDENLTGKFEGDFSPGHYRIRRAFVEHHFDNFYVLIGQEWGIEEVHTFSNGIESPAGINGHVRMPQVQVGTNLDLNGATLDLALAFEDHDYTGMKKRETMPGIAAKVNLGIETGFGNPAHIYAFGVVEPVKIYDPTGSDFTDDPTKRVSGSEDKSETPVIFGAGFTLPISMVTLQSEYIHAEGANEFAGLVGYDKSGVINKYNTPSYYDDGGDVETNKFNAYNIEAKVAPMPNVSVAGGYDYLKFTEDLSNNPNVYKGLDKPEMQTYFANVAWNTTKYTKLVLEWDHAKYETDGDSDDIDGNQYWLDYKYIF